MPPHGVRFGAGLLLPKPRRESLQSSYFATHTAPQPQQRQQRVAGACASCGNALTTDCGRYGCRRSGDRTSLEVMGITRREAVQYGVAGLSVVALEAMASTANGATSPTITCLGDSISDGLLKDDVYPTWLARYLAPIPVVADGVSGESAHAILARCQRDGIHTGSRVHKPGSITFVLAGIVDVMFTQASATGITADLSRIYEYLAHHGSRVQPVTILPWGKSPWFKPDRESVRVAVNRWIVHHPHAVRSELTMSDGAHPPNLRHEFDDGDGVHPRNVIGPQVLALTCALALVPR